MNESRLLMVAGLLTGCGAAVEAPDTDEASNDLVYSAEAAAALESVGDNLRRLARELFPDAAARRPDFDAVVTVVVQAIQGATLGSLASGDRSVFAPMLALLTDFVRKNVS